MPRRRRTWVSGYPYHVTHRGNDGQELFRDDADRQVFLDKMLSASQVSDIEVHAYVLMSNHVHLLLSGGRFDAIPRAMQHANLRYTQYFNARHGCSGTIWETRYWAGLIEADRYLLACLRYVELNPVRAGLASQPDDFRWSSYRVHAGGADDPLVTPHATYLSLGADAAVRQRAYRALASEPLTATELEFIRSRTRQRSAIGSDQFIGQIEATTGASLRARARGRPRHALPRAG